MKLLKQIPYYLTLVYLSCASVVVLAENGKIKNVDAMAEELVKLRSQVEELNSELDNKKNSYKSRMLMLANQRAELETNLKREGLSIKQLQQSINKNKKLIKELGSDSSTLNPVILSSIDSIKEYVKSGLPFKKGERVKELEKISEQLTTGVIDAEKAANRLWASVEDEIRLTKENGLYRQTVVIKDREVLADVAKLGMMFLYFKLPEEKYGVVKPGSGDYEYELVHDSEQKNQIAALFDSLKKQIRQGYFQLPNVVAPVAMNVAQ